MAHLSSPTPGQSLERLALHDHLCLIYETQAEQFSVIAPFMRNGLEQGERCLYIADENTEAAVRQALAEADVDVETAVRSGALAIVTRQETYLREGHFNPESMLHFLAEAAGEAVARGFSALRVAGEMTWALESAPGVEHLMEYEARANDLVSEHNLIVICQYNRRRLAPALILKAIQAHPLIVFGGLVCKNAYYIPPDEFLKPDRTGQEVERMLNHIRDRQQVEEALAESEERYRSLVELSPDPVVVIKEGRFAFVNPAAAELLGAPGAGALIDRPVMETIHPADRARATERIHRITRAAPNPPVEIRLLGLDGQTRIIESRSMPFRYEGQPATLIIGRDVSEREQAQEALQKSEQMFRSLVEQSRDGIILLNDQGTIIEWNQAQERINGLHRAEVIGRPLWDVQFQAATEENRTQAAYEQLKAMLQKFFRTRQAPWLNRPVEQEIRRADATRRTIQSVIFPIQTDGGYMVGSVSRDITDQKEMEQALRESEARFRRLAEKAPDIIYRYRVVPTPGFDYISPAVTAVTGYTPEDCYQDPLLFDKILHPGDPSLLEEFQKKSPVGAGTPLVIRLIHKDGSVVWTEHRLVSISDEAGNVCAVEGIARNISARKQAEQRERLAYELGRRLATHLDQDALLAETVNHLNQAFGYYHTHIYLYQDTPERSPLEQGKLVVRAATGETGIELLRRAHAIPLNAEKSLVARAARSLQPVVVNNVRRRPDFLPNPLLPDTQSEAAIPLFSGQRLIGVLDLQHASASHFDESETRTLQLVAGQLSVALANARLFTENARRSAIIENSSDLIALADPQNFSMVYINPAGARLMGYNSPEEVIGRTPADFHLPEDLERIRQEALATAFKRGLWRGESRLRCADGRTVPVEQTILIIEDEQGQPHTLATIMTDITDRKQAERALRQRNQALNLLNRAGRVFISTLDLDRVLTVILKEVRLGLDVIAVSVWLIDPATDELVCRQVTDPQSQVVRGWRLKPGQGLAGWVASRGEGIIAPDVLVDERHFKGVDEMTGLALRSILTVPLRAREKVIGVLQVVDTRVNRFNSADLALLESLAATAAIAIENARLYEQARQDAETKSALLAEVNHRVKNNLSAIVGLLYAEQRHAGMENQPIYQIILYDLINRVQGLATVHSMLSAAEWAPLSLADLALQVIHSSLQALPRDRHITVTVNPAPIRVTPQQAHNLALVINELATNTVQHAMAGRTTGQIAVKISLEEGTIRCELRDDGPGFPDNVLQANKSDHSLGFELVQNIVYKSLRGEITFYNDNGAVAVIQFKNLVSDGVT